MEPRRRCVITLRSFQWSVWGWRLVFTGTAVAKGTNVGTYKMGLDKGQFSNTSANFSNVTFVVENDGSLTISPREVVLTSDSAEKSYDGTALTKNEQSNVKVSGDGFAKGEARALTLLVLRRTLVEQEYVHVHPERGHAIC